MNFKIILAVNTAKLARFGLRVLGRGGTDFPGRLALKICKNLLGFLAKDVTTVIVTGTNGKTTTTRMIEKSLTDSKISFFTNKSGANLLSGVTLEYALNSNFFGKCKYKYALIEADEAALKQISKYVDAKVIVVTNVFRDQLDRYGEVTHTLRNIEIGIENSPNAILCINGDDSLATSLENDRNKVMFYGVDTEIYKTKVTELSDAPYCIKCKTEYNYSYITYGHLGGYSCPNCGYSRPTPSVAVTQVLSSDTERSNVVITSDGKEYETLINLPGGYNIYNAAATFACGKALNLEPDVVSTSLSAFSCGFGRMEKFEIEGASLRMILIKNPAGCNQVLNFLTSASTPSVFVACLNDGTQDGKDISWIWDVDFERLLDMGENLKTIYVSGRRADDLAVRFKYAGIPLEKLQVISSYDTLVKELIKHKEPVFIMPTYTAMMDLRAHISKTFGFKNFWE